MLTVPLVRMSDTNASTYTSRKNQGILLFCILSSYPQYVNSKAQIFILSRKNGSMLVFLIIIYFYHHDFITAHFVLNEWK